MDIRQISTYIPTRTSGLAVTSLITRILSYFIIPFIGAIVAIVTGHFALRDIGASDGIITWKVERLQAWY